MAYSLLIELKLTSTKQAQTIEKPPNMYMYTKDIIRMLIAELSIIVNNREPMSTNNGTDIL